jgi:hypothetical protein
MYALLIPLNVYVWINRSVVDLVPCGWNWSGTAQLEQKSWTCTCTWTSVFLYRYPCSNWDETLPGDTPCPGPRPNTVSCPLNYWGQFHSSAVDNNRDSQALFRETIIIFHLGNAYQPRLGHHCIFTPVRILCKCITVPWQVTDQTLV